MSKVLLFLSALERLQLHFPPRCTGLPVPISRWLLPSVVTPVCPCGAGTVTTAAAGGDGDGDREAPGRLGWRRVTHGELDAAWVRAGTAAKLYISPHWSLLMEPPSTAPVARVNLRIKKTPKPKSCCSLF